LIHCGKTRVTNRSRLPAFARRQDLAACRFGKRLDPKSDPKSVAAIPLRFIMSTPSWLKSFAARKKPKLDDPEAAVTGSGGGTTPAVDVSAVNDYMAEELLQVIGSRKAVECEIARR
jgi:hypothetical protein